MYLVAKVSVIKEKREAMGLSAHGLSLKAGLNGNSIFRIESGECKLTQSLRAREIARALNCKTSDIFAEYKKGK